MGRLKGEVNVGKQCSSAFWMPGCDPNRIICLKQVLDDVPAKKAGPAEYGHLLARHRSKEPFRVRFVSDPGDPRTEPGQSQQEIPVPVVNQIRTY